MAYDWVGEMAGWTAMAIMVVAMAWCTVNVRPDQPNCTHVGQNTVCESVNGDITVIPFDEK